MLLQNQLNLIIPRRSHSCHHHQGSFCPGDDYVSYLYLSQEEWVRQDYCLTCWESKEEKNEGTFWRGKIPSKKTKVNPSHEKLFLLFRHLLEKDVEIEKPLLFIVALILERQKRIFFRPEVKNKSHETLRHYEIPETGEMVSVPVLTLTVEESSNLFKNIETKLSECIVD